MKLGYLKHNYIHDLSIYGRASWLEKHRRYAMAEAAGLRKESDDDSIGRLFSKDRLARRRTLKRVSFRLPFRPTIRFLYQYGLRGGFLDGKQGLDYCVLLARYEQFISEEIDKLKVSPPGDA
jgi:hypothetical protein